jgi:hypothetical protein
MAAKDYEMKVSENSSKAEPWNKNDLEKNNPNDLLFLYSLPAMEKSPHMEGKGNGI